MKTASLLIVAGCCLPGLLPAQNAEQARWAAEARNVTITRDDWGIAHVHGKTDADAVFGAEYAQAEDDFNRVETNYLNAMGRLAEAEGESAIWSDLRMKLFINPDTLKADYAASPAWLKSLMVAFADGLNYYLARHPDVHPRVITHFEPWMALSFTEGSIGGDIEKANLGQLRTFYSSAPAPASSPAPEDGEEIARDPGGSNGMAISPANTRDHHALLLINPHTSFFFRSELQMTSDAGLNAYGAATWGQFFIYQGFNDKIGWMHTSSGVDAVDEYLETVTQKGGKYFYKYGTADKPFVTETITVPYKTDHGMEHNTYTAYFSQHGPVIANSNGKWETIRLMNEPVKALEQSYTRTKARDYKTFRASLELHTNSSNNTIFASAQGDIAYFHGNFIPRRDTSFDWTRPVDGSNPATDWHGLLSVDETPHLLNPASGWIYNSNNWPWSASGPSSPKRADYPVYVETGRVESARGVHAVRVLSDKKDFTLDGLLAAAFDSYQPWFEKPIPALIKAWDAASASDTLKAKLADQIALLRTWDLRWGAGSVETSLAVYWGEDMMRRVGRGRGAAGGGSISNGVENAPADQLLAGLAAASDKLTADFGTWKTPWGDINRFQRLNDDITATFTDAGPSIPVMFSTATWGSLASFAARAYPGTKKRYGTSGNSFVAVIEFGDSVRARAVTAGGESGDPKSPHFNDEALRYSTGNLRTVYFYPSQLKGHTERVYHPGE
ncbi:MAG TPA: penicillin acylase family protein [Gemmatimonadales bacterium]|nr:penicillin acylase family protein [Gemmatimonadales bacterium]